MGLALQLCMVRALGRGDDARHGLPRGVKEIVNQAGDEVFTVFVSELLDLRRIEDSGRVFFVSGVGGRLGFG